MYRVSIAAHHIHMKNMEIYNCPLIVTNVYEKRELELKKNCSYTKDEHSKNLLLNSKNTHVPFL